LFGRTGGRSVEGMTDYPIHTLDTAPEWAAQPLGRLQEAFGFVPSAAGAMANSAALLHSFLSAFGRFRGEASFTPAERQVILLSNAVANDCAWAVAFHTLEAHDDGVPAADIDAIRDRRPLADARLAALSRLAQALITKRGRLDGSDTAGLEPVEVLEVITGVAISTMTNYAAAVADPPLQEQYRRYAWDPRR
jgi:AhpD family alkylhydroperoxidase